VGEKRGLEVILPAAGVLYGGTDITDDVLAVLN
jgi:Skp family chaperone for outer membrane proteins